MKLEPKNALAQRLKELGCERLPAWVQDRLLPTVEAQAQTVALKAQRQLRRQIARQITVKTVAAAIVAGAPAPTGTGEMREGFQVFPAAMLS